MGVSVIRARSRGKTNAVWVPKTTQNPDNLDRCRNHRSAGKDLRRASEIDSQNRHRDSGCKLPSRCSPCRAADQG